MGGGYARAVHSADRAHMTHGGAQAEWDRYSAAPWPCRPSSALDDVGDTAQVVEVGELHHESTAAALIAHAFNPHTGFE
jgi:hypothetical protein